jgi:hypothetical protein
MLPGHDARPLRDEFKRLMLRGFAVFTAAEKTALKTSLGIPTSVASAGENGDILPGYLFGCTMSTAGASTTMSFAAGRATSSAGTQSMALSAIAKTISAWAVGTAAGGLDTGTAIGSAFGGTSSFATSVMTCTIAPTSGTFQVGQTIAADGVPTGTTIASLGTGTGGTGTYNLSTSPGTLAARATTGYSWYHGHVMRRPDTGVVDVAFSRSASAPTTGGNIPAAYTQFRRVGSGLLDANAQWMPFLQDGDDFSWLTPILDVNATNPGTSAVTRYLTTPPGVNCQANLLASLVVGPATTAYFSDLATADLAPSNSASPLGQLNSFQNAANSGLHGQIVIRTNTSSQIRTRVSVADPAIVLRAATTGWVDRRGRDA